MAGAVKEKDDQILDLLGPFGRWQLILVLIVSVSGVFSTWQILVMSFLTPKVDYFCTPRGPDEGEGKSYAEWAKIAKDLLPENQTLSQCNVTDYIPGESLLVTDEPCSHWLYNKSFYRETLITQFDLVCDYDTMVTLSQMIFMLGMLIGAVTSGVVSDRIGRRYTIITFAFLLAAVGVITSFSNSVAMFLIMRFLVAFFSIGTFTTAYVYCMEMVGGVWSVIIGIGLEFPWALGYSVLPAVAYAVPEWSWLQLTITIPLILFAFVTLILPESPRWLLAEGRLEEAEDVLDRALEINGSQFPEGMKLVPAAADGSSATFLDLFRTPNMCKKTLIQYYLWFTCSMVYYGLTLNSETLVPGGDFHINFMVAGLTEFPAYAITIIVLLYFGRRLPLCILTFLGGVSLIVLLFVPSGVPALIVSSIGKFGITAAFAIIYLYAAELYPTVLRQTGLGSSSMCARVGSILAPVIGRELSKTSTTPALLIFAAVSIVAGLLTLWLPETHGYLLPDSVEEGEEFGKGCGPLQCGPTAKRADKSGVENKGFN